SFFLILTHYAYTTLFRSAHAPMEPLNCTVRIDADDCEIWTGTQFQQFDQMAAARITGLPVEKVKLHTMFLGGGFGRRATPTSDRSEEHTSELQSRENLVY